MVEGNKKWRKEEWEARTASKGHHGPDPIAAPSHPVQKQGGRIFRGRKERRKEGRTERRNEGTKKGGNEGTKKGTKKGRK